MISGLESISVQRATLIYLVLLSGCSSNTEPKLEQWADGVYQERQVKAYDITGKRDGGTTRAVAIITRKNGDRLYLTLKVTYDPKPVLDAGYWRLEGTRGIKLCVPNEIYDEGSSYEYCNDAAWSKMQTYERMKGPISELVPE